MKDNMVQELLLRALLAKQPATGVPSTNTNQRQNASLSTQNNSREVLTALLKSLYLNNAPKQTASNTNNTNVNMGQKTPNNGVIQTDKPVVFEEFMKQNPYFFNGREVLFEYLNSLGANFDKEELGKIAQIVKRMEEDAIKRFCAKNPKYANFLQQENSKFLNKLENNGKSEIDGSLKSRQYYSASDIDSMTTDEFLKHEDEINAQIMDLIRS